MNKVSLNSYYIVEKFSAHNEFKNTLLQLIEKTNSETLFNYSNFYSDSISKLDWHLNKISDRDWVQFLLPELKCTLDNIADNLGYQSFKINEIWFQQYLKNDSHGWHIHGSNFTGVYYLELNQDSPITELLDPFTQNTVVLPKITEGDILIFPSYVLHRAPVIKTNQRKTIVSFNLDVDIAKSTLVNIFK